MISIIDCRTEETMAGALVPDKCAEPPLGFAEQLKEAYDKGKAEGVKIAVIDESNAWKSIKINIAIIGKSGVGKSTLTKAICGCTSEDQDGTSVDYIDGSKTIECFPFPKNPNSTLWDIPGVGTSDFPKQEYLKLIDIDKYDCFLIIVNTRFTMDDVWLAEEIKKREKGFCYVYTKIDQAVKSKKMEKQRRLTEGEVTEVVDKIRRIVFAKIQEHNIIDIL